MSEQAGELAPRQSQEAQQSGQQAPRSAEVQRSQRAPWHQRGWWPALLVAAVGSAAAVTVLVMLLVPALTSAFEAETTDGQRSYDIGEWPTGGEEAASDLGSTSTVTPESGWSVQPDGDGLLLRSPDRLLVVTMTSEVAERQEPSLGGEALVEVLSNGLELRHVTENGVFTGELATLDGPLYIEAHLASQTEPERTLADYRPALSALIESVRAP